MNRTLVGAAAVVALLCGDGVAGAAADVAADHRARASAPPRALTRALPVLDTRGTIHFLGRQTVAPASVTSIGATVRGLTITASAGEARSRVTMTDRSGSTLHVFESVVGIALVDPAGDVAAWIEQVSEGSPRRVVAVDTATGELIAQRRVAARTQVMTVHAGVIALGDGDDSRLWTPGRGVQRLDYVPDDHYVVGLTGTRVVATDLTQTIVHRRRTGQLIARMPGLTWWDVSAPANLLAGVTKRGTVRLVHLGDGETHSVDPGVNAATASFGSDGSLVVLDARAFTSRASTTTVSLCTRSGRCRDVESNSSGLGYLPNDALAQVLSQSG